MTWKKYILQFLIITLLTVNASNASAENYPLIRITSAKKDPLYRQQQQDVEAWYTGTKPSPALTIFSYKPLRSENLFSVAAAFNLPYDTIATLNRMENPGIFNPDNFILIPNIPGLFIPEKPTGRWEKMLKERKKSTEPQKIIIEEVSRTTMLFYPGEKFSAEERIRFLGSLFSSPLENTVITSPFGYRDSPIHGGLSFHPGVDLRAKTGTEVKAARDGIIKETGELKIYGNYVIIKHDGGYESVYAHLSRILVKVNQHVNAGDVIALSGNSGISTGPHLHFEIRKDGKPVNPSQLTSFYDLSR